MVRLVVMALLGLSLPVAAWSAEPPAQAAPPKPEISAPQTYSSRNFSLSPSSLSYEAFDGFNTHTEIAPNARFGFGIFGLKKERSREAPVTVREIGTPRTRRAGVGLSVRF